MIKREMPRAKARGIFCAFGISGDKREITYSRREALV